MKVTYSAFGREFETVEEAKEYGRNMVLSGEVYAKSFVLFARCGNAFTTLERVDVETDKEAR